MFFWARCIFLSLLSISWSAGRDRSVHDPILAPTQLTFAVGGDGYDMRHTRNHRSVALAPLRRWGSQNLVPPWIRPSWLQSFCDLAALRFCGDIWLRETGEESGVMCFFSVCGTQLKHPLCFLSPSLLPLPLLPHVPPPWEKVTNITRERD